ncbi:MAG TPA: methyltransferase domain-containing protein [Acidimicrobiales bacterium]|nr:methyltransferase domain-containing protein [Acidimicrobiales bacterium]
MQRRLLSLVCCPTCGGALDVEPEGALDQEASQIADGTLRCACGQRFPVRRGVPRLLPESGHDERTEASFGLEWDYHEVGDRTWGWEVGDRVHQLFVDPMRIPVESLEGKVLLDAGCGNGSQSVAYSELGLEVVAVDVSSGVERGRALLEARPPSRPDRVHFVQADLQHPPLPPSSVDLIHSFGVLHHTPNTEHTFRTLSRVLRPGGTFYLWVHKREPVVTTLLTVARAVTTRIPPKALSRLARILAVPFELFRVLLNRLGIRECPPFSPRESALAILDIFGAPHSHYHTRSEVEGWFRDEGFVEVWAANDDRRGFGVVGRKAP